MPRARVTRRCHQPLWHGLQNAHPRGSQRTLTKQGLRSSRGQRPARRAVLTARHTPTRAGNLLWRETPLLDPCTPTHNVVMNVEVDLGAGGVAQGVPQWSQVQAAAGVRLKEVATVGSASRSGELVVMEVRRHRRSEEGQQRHGIDRAPSPYFCAALLLQSRKLACIL